MSYRNINKEQTVLRGTTRKGVLSTHDWSNMEDIVLKIKAKNYGILQERRGNFCGYLVDTHSCTI